MVDARRFGIHQREPSAVDRQQLLDEGVGQGRRAGGLAEHRGRQQILGGRIGRRGRMRRGRPARSGRLAGVGSSVSARSAACGPPNRASRLVATAREVGNVFWQSGFHPWSPKVSRATSIRCTSMVPDATVAAWA